MVYSDDADHPPGQTTTDDNMNTHHVRRKLERSLRAAKTGKVISQEEMEKRYLDDARCGRK